MTPTQQLTPAQRFFFERAAFSYDPRTETPEAGRTRGAIDYADAEQLCFDAMRDAGVTFAVELDADATEPECDQLYMFALYDAAGKIITSLSAIDDNSTDYQRVVRAELAHEAADILRAAIQEANE